VLQLTRGGHVQTFADPTWRQVMLRFDDPSISTACGAWPKCPITLTRRTSNE
jgi:hypothetical protein